MKLVEAIQQMSELDRDHTIFVRRPWTPDAECLVRPLEPDGGIPKATKAAGYDYFLELEGCFEVLEAFGDYQPTLDEKVRVILYYAENDAWPDWVSELAE